jgi:uncharacterized Zn finger protein
MPPEDDEEVTINTFCENCSDTTPHDLTDEHGIMEVYTCEDCGQSVEYAVR